jgi:phenylacetate-coenzyme A ligase PaaK-like adenylate-forming protein
VLLSHLNRRGTVLLRYAVGDLSAVASGRCETCGRDGPRFVVPPERGDVLVKVRGTLVNPVAVIEAASGVPGVDDFQVAVANRDPGDPLSGDEIVVRFTGASKQADAVGTAIAAAVREACEVTPRTVYLAPGEFAALSEVDVYKFRRFRDERSDHAKR